MALSLIRTATDVVVDQTPFRSDVDQRTAPRKAMTAGGTSAEMIGALTTSSPWASELAGRGALGFLDPLDDACRRDMKGSICRSVFDQQPRADHPQIRSGEGRQRNAQFAARRRHGRSTTRSPEPVHRYSSIR